MTLLELRLNTAREAGEKFVTITLMTSHHPELVARTVEDAESMHWHVASVWGANSCTYVLLKHRPE